MKTVLERLIEMIPRPVAVVTFLALAGVSFVPSPARGAEQNEPRVVLAGERFAWVSSSKQIPDSDVPAKVSALIKCKVEDQLADGVKVADLDGRIDAITASKPEIVVLFLGAADEKAGTKDETVIATLASAAKKLVDAGARVFVVPSSVSLGAASGANLGIAAEKAGATFIEPGNVIDQRPYEEAFEAINRALQQPPKPPATVKVATPAATQEEVSAPAEPAASTKSTSATVAAAEGGTTTSARLEGGAPATIIMRSPLTPKQFDPKKQSAGRKRGPKKPAVAN